MNYPVIIGAKRTPIGRFQGVFSKVSSTQLGAAAIRAAITESGIGADLVQQVIMGQVLTAGVGQAPARQAALGAGLSQHAQAVTVNKVCGSGLQAIIQGAQSLLLGDAHVVVAGGQENMTLAPYALPGAREGLRMGHKEMVDTMIRDGLWDPYNNQHMGNCAEVCAAEKSFSREAQDAFAKNSYEKTLAAYEHKLFDPELTPVEVSTGKTTTLVSQDEEPFAADLSKMAQLRPAFDKAGTITAANASKINDGAAACVLTLESHAKTLNAKPLARILGWASHAQDPVWFTTAPAEAIRRALAKAELTLEQVDLFEINEAFAVVTMAAMEELKIPAQKVNVRGGACALGHPLGASGARLMVTLVHALRQSQKRYGVASLCIGGGEGIAMVVEAL